MCSRVCLSTDLSEVSAFLGLCESKARLRPHWNISPGHLMPVVRVDDPTHRRRLDLMRWGLIPAFAKSAIIVRSHLSAWEIGGSLNESLQYPARRCLVPVDNFYEWRLADGQPFAVALASRHILTLAAIWDVWASPLGERVACFALLTTDANDMMAPLCKQMPVIIRPADWSVWLGSEVLQERTLLDLLRPIPDDLLTAWAVSRRLRNTKNDDPGILAAV
jgi:putative SOS response-associated peptidase YedK